MLGAFKPSHFFYTHARAYEKASVSQNFTMKKDDQLMITHQVSFKKQHFASISSYEHNSSTNDPSQRSLADNSVIKKQNVSMHGKKK